MQQNALDPSLPWAIEHAVLALGADVSLENGHNAIDWLFSEYAIRTPIGTEFGLAFPAAKGKTVVEPHPHLVLKALTDIGVPFDRTVTVEGQTHTVSDLYKGALATTWYDPSTSRASFHAINEATWTLMALSSWSNPDTTWSTPASPGDGSVCTASSLDSLADVVATALHADTRFLAKAKATNSTFTKRRQGVYKYTCGGAHLMQGVLHAHIQGIGSRMTERGLEEQVSLLLYRLPIELQQIDSAMESNPQYKIPLAVQRLKLTGHTLETLGRISTSSHPKAPAPALLKPVIEEVIKSVELLNDFSVYKHLHIAKTENHQLFLDVVGDSAHALRGLNIAYGDQAVYY